MEAWERQNQAATGENHNNVPQLKEEDILRMNQGNADFLYNDEGYVTFLRGRFYEDKVTDTEKGVESLMGIAELLGLSRGSEFFAVYGEQDEYGYTYLTYKQRYGDLTLENAVLKIILDPQGYTAGLVSKNSPCVIRNSLYCHRGFSGIFCIKLYFISRIPVSYNLFCFLSCNRAFFLRGHSHIWGKGAYKSSCIALWIQNDFQHCIFQSQIA